MFKKSRIAILLVTAAMLSVMLAACGGDSGSSSGSGNATSTATAAAKGPTCANGNIAFDGSTALYPLANDVAGKYQDKCSGATITPKQSGSTAGLQAANDGTVAIGNSDIFADKTKFPDLQDNQVAVVVFSVILNKDVTGVTNLTSQQLADIYTGKVTNWKDVGGPDKQITTISRKPGSGTRVTFDTYVLNGATEKSDASTVTANSSSDVSTTIGNTSGALAYDTSFYAKKQNLTTIKIDGDDASDENVKINKYKFWNIEHMYTKGAPKELAKNFIDYMKSDDADVVASRKNNGFLGLSFMDKAALDAKQPKA